MRQLFIFIIIKEIIKPDFLVYRVRFWEMTCCLVVSISEE